MTAPLRLMSHNPDWQQAFEQARSLLMWACDGWISQIEHVGSTCLPDSIARPTIDLLAGMDDLRGINQAAQLIEGLGYVRTLSPDWCADEFTAQLQKPRLGDATHSVLIVRRGGAAWNSVLSVRDWLQRRSVDRQMFFDLKRRYLIDVCDAVERYTAAKQDFFASLPPDK